MFSALILSAIISLCIIDVKADTEIVNFNSHVDFDIQISVPWVVNVLEPGRAVDFHMAVAPSSKNVSQICGDWTTGMCPYEMWFSLPCFPEGRKTLRFSWPAFFPASLQIHICTPSSLLSLIHNISAIGPGSMTLSDRAACQYARIWGQGRAIRVPSLTVSSTIASHWPFYLLPSPTLAANDLVPFQVMYEPLILGVIPSSLASIIVILAVVITIACRLSSSIFSQLSMIADSVILETKEKLQ